MPRKSGSDRVDIKEKKTVKNKSSERIKKNIMEGIEPEDLIFALDIGTRTVVGILGIEEKSKFRVLAAEILEHKSRAMVDGQIHDVSKVAEIANVIKKRIEESLGITLTKVAIAAAGRVLKTSEVTVEREIDPSIEIDKELVSSIEMQAIQEAQLKLECEVSKEEKNQFYCVGYSIIHYYLNGYLISSLAGHKGKKIGAKILATFLPHIVVDSLYTVMSRIGLEVVSMTLEPIAAINVTIPPDLRLLNLALVDIGAGTSDIAITKDGSVIAYSMVPIAGDEITEKIAQHYLVDFNTGERIKTALSLNKQNIEFVDILGKKHVIDIDEIRNQVTPIVDHLAQTIAQGILAFNGKAPNAVFLIGGGSQTPDIAVKIARNLGLAEERVVVRGREIIQNIRYTGKKLTGPESITPFGIAITALMQRGQDFLSVKVNGRKLRIFNSRKLTVADALVLIGFDAEQLIGRSGKSIRYELNGVKRILKGEYGKPAEIYVNGGMASLETVLKMNDEIEVIAAEKGRDAAIKISDLIGVFSAYPITLNGIEQKVGTRVYINGNECSVDGFIEDGNVIKTTRIITLEDLVIENEIDLEYFDLLINNCMGYSDHVLEQGDQIECVIKSSDSSNNVQTVENDSREEFDLQSNYNLEQIELHMEKNQMNNQHNHYIQGGICITVNDKKISINENKSELMFVEIFNYIDFDISKPQGSIVLKLNSRQAAFTDIVRNGDRVEVYWEK